MNTNNTAPYGILETGRPFPVTMPSNDFAFLEMWGGMPHVIIQFNHVRTKEFAAYERGFERYSYIEHLVGNAIVAAWTFDYPSPFNEITVNFNAKIVSENHIRPYLECPDAPNGFTFILLDRGIVRHLRYSGMNNHAARLFRATVVAQLAGSYTTAEYAKADADLQRHSIKELLRMGQGFRHSKDHSTRRNPDVAPHIAASLGLMAVPGKRYHSALPPDLERWYCYVGDSGHCILSGMKDHFRAGTNLADWLVPVPVKTVLRGYTIREGHVVVDLPYSRELGVPCPAEDDEF